MCQRSIRGDVPGGEKKKFPEIFLEDFEDFCVGFIILITQQRNSQQLELEKSILSDYTYPFPSPSYTYTFIEQNNDVFKFIYD